MEATATTLNIGQRNVWNTLTRSELGVKPLHANIFQDFNLVRGVEKDKKGGAPTTHLKSKEEVLSLKEQFQLADIWRINNPDIMRFTWDRTNAEICCRLDFFLISESLCPNILEAEIHPGYRTDYCLN